MTEMGFRHSSSVVSKEKRMASRWCGLWISADAFDHLAVMRESNGDTPMGDDDVIYMDLLFT